MIYWLRRARRRLWSKWHIPRCPDCKRVVLSPPGRLDYGEASVVFAPFQEEWTSITETHLRLDWLCPVTRRWVTFSEHWKA